jgi:hypothetical protein
MKQIEYTNTYWEGFFRTVECSERLRGFLEANGYPVTVPDWHWKKTRSQYLEARYKQGQENTTR